jgi:hypothetical protein
MQITKSVTSVYTCRATHQITLTGFIMRPRGMDTPYTIYYTYISMCVCQRRVCSAFRPYYDTLLVYWYLDRTNTVIIHLRHSIMSDREPYSPVYPDSVTATTIIYNTWHMPLVGLIRIPGI